MTATTTIAQLREAAIAAQRRQAALITETSTLNPHQLQQARQAIRERTSRAVLAFADAAGIDPLEAAVQIITAASI